MTYYVQIPCFITRDRPNRTATADRWLVIPIEADSQAEALGRAEKALTYIAESEPPEIDTEKHDRDIDIDDGC